jgi:O-acetyl-ADP-ribose deacetylase
VTAVVRRTVGRVTIECLADERGVASVGFPAISTGVFGYPLEEAAKVALIAVAEVAASLKSVGLVRFVLHDERALQIHEDALEATWRPS